MYGNISFNCVGIVARDVEIVEMRNGKKRAAVLCAINMPKKLADGSYEQETTWVRFAAFGDRVNSPTIQNCKKGVPIYVEGKIFSYKEELAGQVRTCYNFRADTIRVLTNVNKIRGGGPQPGEPPSGDLQDDDIPFD